MIYFPVIRPELVVDLGDQLRVGDVSRAQATPACSSEALNPLEQLKYPPLLIAPTSSSSQLPLRDAINGAHRVGPEEPLSPCGCWRTKARPLMVCSAHSSIPIARIGCTNARWLTLARCRQATLAEARQTLPFWPHRCRT